MTLAGKIYRCNWKPTQTDYVGPGCCFEFFPTTSAPKVHGDQLAAAHWYFTKSRGVVDIASILCPKHRGGERGKLMEDPTRWIQLEKK